MKLTLKDIAKMTNLSESTVSRALNDHPNISQKTKDIVMKIAEENKYTVNMHARSLAISRSNRIGIVFPNDFYEFNKRDFFSQLEKYFLEHAEKLKYDVSLIRTNSIEKVVKSGFVDGLIIVTRDMSKDDLEILEQFKLPYVFVAYLPTCLKEEEIQKKKINVFKSDNVKAGYMAAQFLFEKGAEKFLTITSSDEKLTDYTDRTIGFLKFLKEKKLRHSGKSIIRCNMTFDEGRELIAKSAEKLKEFDGIFCQQDKVALGIISAAEKNNVSIPEDIMLIGHDDIELIDYFVPRLTSIRQDFESITSKALEYLIDKIEEVEKTKYNFLSESSIVIRDTTK